MGAGRPAKAAGEKQRNAVTTKYTDGEFSELQRAAEGEPLAAYIRRLVLRHLARRRRRK